MSIALFRAYPKLAQTIPYAPVAELPTPVAHLASLGNALGHNALYLKQDDLTGRAYGGNKVRKLAFLLARAREDGAKTVLTFGAAGSNHCVATAIYAREHGLNCISMLVPQVCVPSVRRNLLRGHVAGAELCHFPGVTRLALGTLMKFKDCKLREGRFPSVIPPGGSSPVGALGYVDAAFELREQIEAGVLPMPDVICVASGTMGTAIGLLLGVLAADLPIRIVAVRVAVERFTNEERGRKLFAATNAVLRGNDPAFPLFTFPEHRFSLRHDFMGEGYAVPTEAGEEARTLIESHEGVKLEGTYTAKTLACAIAAVRAGEYAGQTVLFWNTHNSRDFSDAIEGVDYHELPPALHTYFED